MASELIIPAVVAVITAIFASGIWSLIAQRKQTAATVEKTKAETKKLEEENKKLKAEADQIVQDSSLEMVMEYKSQLKEVRAELALVRNQQREQEIRFTADIESLRAELKEAYVEINSLNDLNRELNKRLSGLER